MSVLNVQPQQIIMNEKRTMNGWAFFDCANSSYSLVISSAVFPAYFAATAPENISFWGMTIPSSAILAYAVTIAYLVIALSSPILSGIADYGGKRKLFMTAFTVVGALACIGMFWMTGREDWHIGFWGYVVATMGYAGGVVFNNSYLPIIATEDRFDWLSARAFTFGYIGSVFLLVVNLPMIIFYKELGFPDESMPTRIAFLMVGFWWLGFAQIPRLRLPADSTTPLSVSAVSSGWAEFKGVFEVVKANKNLKNYLCAYFFFDAGVQCVLFMATIFAAKVLNFKTPELIRVVLILQVVAALGSWLFAKVSAVKGNLWSITVMLIVWFFICIAAYLVQTKTQFYILGAVLGAVMGGIQSLSRSTYSKLIPADTEDVTSFFSFYDVTDKVAVVVGTFAFGFIDQLTGDIRNSTLALSLFFIVGLVLIKNVKLSQKKLIF
ncbi:MAG: MFS transporter [Saprospiraceae bacterium]|nr:MFS transporter [Saprospiraceae bacterium]